MIFHVCTCVFLLLLTSADSCTGCIISIICCGCIFSRCITPAPGSSTYSGFCQECLHGSFKLVFDEDFRTSPRITQYSCYNFWSPSLLRNLCFFYFVKSFPFWAVNFSSLLHHLISLLDVSRYFLFSFLNLIYYLLTPVTRDKWSQFVFPFSLIYVYLY